MTLLTSPDAAASAGLDAETLEDDAGGDPGLRRATRFPKNGSCSWTTTMCAPWTWSGGCAATS